jgi:hypothetical protein
MPETAQENDFGVGKAIADLESIVGRNRAVIATNHQD